MPIPCVSQLTTFWSSVSGELFVPRVNISWAARRRLCGRGFKGVRKRNWKSPKSCLQDAQTVKSNRNLGLFYISKPCMLQDFLSSFFYLVLYCFSGRPCVWSLHTVLSKLSAVDLSKKWSDKACASLVWPLHQQSMIGEVLVTYFCNVFFSFVIYWTEGR